MTKNLFSQLNKKLTLQVNTLDMCNVGIDMPFTHKFSLNYSISFASSYLFSENYKLNHNFGVRKYIDFNESSDMQSSFYFYTGLRFKKFSCFSRIDQNEYEEGHLNAIYIPFCVGIKRRVLDCWIGFDRMIYAKENVTFSYLYSSKPKYFYTFRPKYDINMGITLNILNLKVIK